MEGRANPKGVRLSNAGSRDRLGEARDLWQAISRRETGWEATLVRRGSLAGKGRQQGCPGEPRLATRSSGKPRPWDQDQAWRKFGGGAPWAPGLIQPKDKGILSKNARGRWALIRECSKWDAPGNLWLKGMVRGVRPEVTREESPAGKWSGGCAQRIRKAGGRS